MLRAVASGATDPATIAALGSPRLKATPDQLRDALGPCTDLHPVYRRLLTMTLDELEVIDAHLGQLDEELARLLREHQDAVERLAAGPGLGVDSPSRSSPKWARPPPPSPRPNGWPRGSAPVLDMTKARGSITVIAPLKAIDRCAVC
jgi:hypothetical protein